MPGAAGLSEAEPERRSAASLLVLGKLEEPADALQLTVEPADRVLVQRLGPSGPGHRCPKLVLVRLVQLVRGQAAPLHRSSSRMPSSSRRTGIYLGGHVASRGAAAERLWRAFL